MQVILRFMIKRLLFVLLVDILALPIQAQVKEQDYTVDKNGDIIVTVIVDNLPLQKDEIYAAAQKYMQEAYRDTKYKITTGSNNETITGEGEFAQFYEANFFPYSYFLNAPILLRVDAKDGRARVSVVLQYYTGKRVNANKTADIQDRISKFYPVNSDENEHKKLYGKAFPLLYKKVKQTLDEVVGMLNSTRSASSTMDANW